MGHLTAIRYEGLINTIISMFTPATLSPVLPLSFYFHPLLPFQEKKMHPRLSSMCKADGCSSCGCRRMADTHAHNERMERVSVNRNGSVSVSATRIQSCTLTLRFWSRFTKNVPLYVSGCASVTYPDVRVSVSQNNRLFVYLPFDTSPPAPIDWGSCLSL